MEQKSNIILQKKYEITKIFVGQGHQHVFSLPDIPEYDLTTSTLNQPMSKSNRCYQRFW